MPIDSFDLLRVLRVAVIGSVEIGSVDVGANKITVKPGT
jgi:hypothetical protein